MGMNIVQSTDAINEFVRQKANYSQTSELGASHIENIILGELINSGSSNYTGLAISATYFGGTIIETTKVPGKPAINTLGYGNLNKLEPPHTRDYYLNNQFNIYTEHGLQDPSN